MEESSKKNTIYIVAGPTASGKTKEAIRLAKLYGGEVISVDSRQVYRRLNIGTEKIFLEEMEGVPHHLIDIREPNESYSAGDFVTDASALISRMHAEGKTPILAGGTHFYFDALLYGLPSVEPNEALRAELEAFSNEELFAKVQAQDPERALHLDFHNRRRLVRSLEVIAAEGSVTPRMKKDLPYDIQWTIINPPEEVLRERIDARLTETLAKGLVEETRAVRVEVGDERLDEFGLEYRIVGEYLRSERTEESLLPTLSSKLWQYARRQKAWLRKLQMENGIETTEEAP